MPLKHLDRTLHVGLENNEKFFDLGLAERFDTAFGRLEHRRLAGLHLTLSGDGLGPVDIGNDLESVARLRNALQAKYLDRRCRRRFGHDLAAVREHRPDLAGKLSDNERIADMQRSLLDKSGRDRRRVPCRVWLRARRPMRAASGSPLIQGCRPEAERFRAAYRDPSRFFAETGTISTSPPQSTGCRPSPARPCLTLSGFASGLIDLVDRDDDRHAGGLRVLDGFDRLRHHAVIGRHHKNDDIRRLGTAGTHHRERFVARRIEKYDPTLFFRIVGICDVNAVSADVLRDSAGFAFGDILRTDRVEQRGFTVIDVSHDGDDRCTRQLGIVGIGGDQFFEFLLDDHFLERNKTDVISEVEAHFGRHFFADRLIERRENAAFDQELNDVARRDAESFGKFADRRAFGQA